MSLSKEELQKEQEYLDKTLKVLRSLITSDDESIAKDQTDVEELKQYFWSSITDMDDMEISTNRQAINSQINRTNQKIEQLSKLKRSLNSPYFGRVDFYSDRRDATVYVGVNGIHDNLDFYVFDWRSPIGSLFYNYNVGPASYEAPIGEIKGEIKLKRQYKIEAGKLVRCFNSDINIDDEFMLGENILVSPVVEQGKTKKLVYLPEGKWICYNTNKTYEGNNYYIVDAPIDTLPMFIKYNSLIPTYTSTNIENPNEIVFECYGENASYKIR